LSALGTHKLLVHSVCEGVSLLPQKHSSASHHCQLPVTYGVERWALSEDLEETPNVIDIKELIDSSTKNKKRHEIFIPTDIAAEIHHT